MNILKKIWQWYKRVFSLDHAIKNTDKILRKGSETSLFKKNAVYTSILLVIAWIVFYHFILSSHARHLESYQHGNFFLHWLAENAKDVLKWLRAITYLQIILVAIHLTRSSTKKLSAHIDKLQVEAQNLSIEVKKSQKQALKTLKQQIGEED